MAGGGGGAGSDADGVGAGAGAGAGSDAAGAGGLGVGTFESGFGEQTCSPSSKRGTSPPQSLHLIIAPTLAETGLSSDFAGDKVSFLAEVGSEGFDSDVFEASSVVVVVPPNPKVAREARVGVVKKARAIG